MLYTSILINMTTVKPKIIIVMGPTSSGKSDVAIQLAQKFNGEIISADSRQVYKSLNLGSGKVFRDPVINDANVFISEGVPHHLIDIAEPTEDFNISHFKTLASLAIEEILSKGKLPIICGGTGFWIDAIVSGTNLPEVPPNVELRKELEEKTCEELFIQLEKLDPERAASIDRENKYRLVRALEIIEKLGKVPSKSSVISHQSSKYNFLEIGISTERETLNTKIKQRLEARFEQGMIEEVESLNKNGVSFEWMEKIGLEYRWISRFLQGKIEREEMQKKLYFDIIHYAKRQMTWFKRNKKILWKESYEEIENEVKKFLA